MKLVLTALLVILGAAAGPRFAAAQTDDFTSQLRGIQTAVDDGTTKFKMSPATQTTDPNDPRYAMQAPFLEMLRKVMPSIVLLVNKKQQALCTGFFLETKDAKGLFTKPTQGLIATNAHCVEKLAVGSAIQVGLYEGNVSPSDRNPHILGTLGQVVAFGNSDYGKDIAFVELLDHDLDRPGLPLCENVDIGEQVAAIGHPLGLGYSVTKGIISALRDEASDQFAVGFDQTDAAINPGNSGGPLFNMWGSVVGINTMVAKANGIALALPAAQIKRALQQYSHAGDLKIGTLPGELEVKPFLFTAFLGVGKVSPGGLMDRAGVKENDLIFAVDGIRQRDYSDFRDYLGNIVAHLRYISPGDTVTLVVHRGNFLVGKDLSLEVPLSEFQPPAPETPNKWWPFPLPKTK